VSGTVTLLQLAGYVGLLLWGAHMVSTGVERGFGAELRLWLGRTLSRPGLVGSAVGTRHSELATLAAIQLEPVSVAFLSLAIQTLFHTVDRHAGRPLDLGSKLAFRDGRTVGGEQIPPGPQAQPRRGCRRDLF
jgi:hypothetical protein